MAKGNLTDLQIEKLKAANPGQRYDKMDKGTGAVSGFGVRVTDKGRKTYILLARYPGSPNPVRRAIGDVDSLSLSEARDKAREWQKLIAKGIDPKQAVTQEAATGQTTFAQAIEDYIAEVVIGADPANPKMRTGYEVADKFRLYFVPRWRDRPVASIEMDEIRDAVRAVEREGRSGKPAPIQARNLLVCIRGFFGWAVVAGKKYGLRTNPAAVLQPKFVFKHSKKIRDRVLTDDELLALWRVSGRVAAPIGPLYRLLILTGLRKNEVAQAQWSELDLEKRRWVIPAERMKAMNDHAREHLVALTDEMVAIFQSIKPGKGPYVFSKTDGEKPVWLGDKIKQKIDERMLRTMRALARVRGNNPQEISLADEKGQTWTNHDIRRTFSTRSPELKHKLITEEVREAFVAHAKRGTPKHYNFAKFENEKRLLGDLWAAYVHQIATPSGGNVIPFSMATNRNG